MAYTTIDDPTIYFNTVLYTGDGSSSRIISSGFATDFVWCKSRSVAGGQHFLSDSVRGDGKLLQAESNAAEFTAAGNGIHANGAIWGNGVGVTGNGETYVNWFWKESATAGFDICSWTGNGSAQNISHNLSKVPTMIIVKNRTDSGTDWYCYNVHNGNTHSILLNSTGAKVGAYTDNWNNTTPTSSVFTVGSSNSTGGSSGDNMIAYVFTDIKGYSKFGSWTGNGGTSNFVYTGFKPSFVLWKNTTNSAGSTNWHIVDTKRNTANVVDKLLFPNDSAVEATVTSLDLLSNGFNIKVSNGYINTSGDTYVYLAFAESPFTNSNGVPTNAR